MTLVAMSQVVRSTGLSLAFVVCLVAGCNAILGFEDGRPVATTSSGGATSSSSSGAAGEGGVGGLGGTGGAPTGGSGGGAAGGGGNAGGSAGGPVSVQVSVLFDDRDAWDDDVEGSVDRCSFSDSDWKNTAGLQWSLPVPSGATVLAAHLSIYPTQYGGDTGAYTATIMVEDGDDPAPYDGMPHDIRDRTYWPSGVDWEVPSGGFPLNQWVDSPPIETLIQRAIDRSGWETDDFVAVSIRGVTSASGSSHRIADVNDNLNRTATLTVEYEPPSR